MSISAAVVLTGTVSPALLRGCQIMTPRGKGDADHLPPSSPACYWSAVVFRWRCAGSARRKAKFQQLREFVVPSATGDGRRPARFLERPADAQGGGLNRPVDLRRRQDDAIDGEAGPFPS